MNKKIFALAATLILAGTAVTPALAADSGSFDTAAQTRSEVKIATRITALNTLQARINQMQKISSQQKTDLTNLIKDTVIKMADLTNKISNDSDNATLKSDIESITQSYRVYVLVMPQIRILSAADRVLTITDLLNSIGLQLQSKIQPEQTSVLSEMMSKTADARVQAQAAINEIAGLKPDNGDKAVFTSNQIALKDARAKIKTATADLQTARKDAGNIIKPLKLK